MPVIQMTVSDALQTMKVEAGVYKAELTKVDVKPSNSGKGNNFFLTFTITAEGQYKGKELNPCISTNMKEGSVLGSMQFLPKGTFNLIEAAVNDKPIDGTDHLIDTDSLVNRPMDLNIGVITVDGNLVNTVMGFSPVGKGQGVPF